MDVLPSGASPSSALTTTGLDIQEITTSHWYSVHGFCSFIYWLKHDFVCFIFPASIPSVETRGKRTFWEVRRIVDHCSRNVHCDTIHSHRPRWFYLVIIRKSLNLDEKMFFWWYFVSIGWNTQQIIFFHIPCDFTSAVTALFISCMVGLYTWIHFFCKNWKLTIYW